MMHTLLQLAEDEPATMHDALVAMLMVLGIVLIAIMLTVSIRGKIANRQANRPSASEQIEQIKAAGHKRSRETGPTADDVDQVRHLAAVLDNKAQRLEQLIAEADLRIEALGGRSMEDAQGPKGREAVGNHEHPVPALESLDPVTQAVYALADEGRSTVEIARELDEQVGKVDLILALRQR